MASDYSDDFESSSSISFDLNESIEKRKQWGEVWLYEGTVTMPSDACQRQYQRLQRGIVSPRGVSSSSMSLDKPVLTSQGLMTPQPASMRRANTLPPLDHTPSGSWSEGNSSKTRRSTPSSFATPKAVPISPVPSVETPATSLRGIASPPHSPVVEALADDPNAPIVVDAFSPSLRESFQERSDESSFSPTSKYVGPAVVFGAGSRQPLMEDSGSPSSDAVVFTPARVVVEPVVPARNSELRVDRVVPTVLEPVIDVSPVDDSLSPPEAAGANGESLPAEPLQQSSPAEERPLVQRPMASSPGGVPIKKPSPDSPKVAPARQRSPLSPEEPVTRRRTPTSPDAGWSSRWHGAPAAQHAFRDSRTAPVVPVAGGVKMDEATQCGSPATSTVNEDIHCTSPVTTRDWNSLGGLQRLRPYKKVERSIQTEFLIEVADEATYATPPTVRKKDFKADDWSFARGYYLWPQTGVERLSSGVQLPPKPSTPSVSLERTLRLLAGIPDVPEVWECSKSVSKVVGDTDDLLLEVILGLCEGVGNRAGCDESRMDAAPPTSYLRPPPPAPSPRAPAFSLSQAAPKVGSKKPLVAPKTAPVRQPSPGASPNRRPVHRGRAVPGGRPAAARPAVTASVDSFDDMCWVDSTVGNAINSLTHALAMEATPVCSGRADVASALAEITVHELLTDPAVASALVSRVRQRATKYK